MSRAEVYIFIIFFYLDSLVTLSVGGPAGKKEVNNLESNNINNNGKSHPTPAPLAPLGPPLAHTCGNQEQQEQASDSDSCDRSDVIFQC